MFKTSIARNSEIADVMHTSESSTIVDGNGSYKRPSFLPLVEESDDGWLDLSSNLSTDLSVENTEGQQGCTARVATDHVQQHYDSRDDDSLRVSRSPPRRNATTDVKLMERATAAELFLAGLMNED
uniref:Uncharacterized protein n=1 Tax=Pseudictyota dubia TaxID=2749911 RepID=A0A6U2FQF8_9STRA|mmetsp:Transcript_39714/g.73206  ORF Transcript_39714/g.73206 Transcript_39714/m.73206 type:complete len:126 (+) Transcript_39714:123-500(+)